MHRGPVADSSQQEGGATTLQHDGVAVASFTQQLDGFIRANIHLIVFALIVAYFVGARVRAWLADLSSRATVKQAAQSTSEQLERGLQAARERQRLSSAEATRRDQELLDQRRMEDLAERERKLRELEQKGKLEDPATAPGAASLPFTQRLPRLPGGDAYRPASTWDASTGGGYRPTGFQRPRRGG